MRRSRRSRAVTRPPTISRTDGRTLRDTSAASHRVGDVANELAVRAGDRQQHLVRAEPADELWDRRASSQDAHIVKDLPVAARIVVDDPDDVQADFGMAEDVVQHLCARLPRPHQQDARPIRVDGAPAEREQTALEPDRSGRHHRERAAEHDHGQRDRTLAAADEGDQPEDEREAHEPGQEHPSRLLHARVLPHLPVEAEQVVVEQMDERDTGKERPEVQPVGGWDHPVEAEHQRDEVRRDDDERVQDGERHVAPHAGDDAAWEPRRAAGRELGRGLGHACLPRGCSSLGKEDA